MNKCLFTYQCGLVRSSMPGKPTLSLSCHVYLFLLPNGGNKKYDNSCMTEFTNMPLPASVKAFHAPSSEFGGHLVGSLGIILHLTMLFPEALSLLKMQNSGLS